MLYCKNVLVPTYIFRVVFVYSGDVMGGGYFTLTINQTRVLAVHAVQQYVKLIIQCLIQDISCSHQY